jgi:hypothetical protein
MPRPSTPARSDWSDERIDALDRAMYPAIFGRTAPARVRCTAPKLISLTAYRLQRPMLVASTLSPPCPD